MNKNKLHNFYLFLGVYIVFMIGIGVGWLLQKYTNPPPASSGKSKSEIHSKGHLTSPLLECNTDQKLGGKEFDKFQTSLEDQVNSYTFAKKATHISVYLRGLNNGDWLGINENENFSPASLLKVPNMISLLKAAEADPSILTKNIVYQKKLEDIEPFFKPDQELEIGKSYTVEELIYRMIVYSDNEAMKLLRNIYDTNFYNRIYADIGINTPDDSNPEDFMTVTSYASFFRILYNASYLSVASSEKALDMLSKVTFRKGLVDGVPAGTIVAHKFGERLIPKGNTEIKQVHDCGIIYVPGNPYLLCIMTRGSDYATLASIIRDLSKSIWEDMKQNTTQ